MKNSRKKRAARERRVLLVALLVAAVIVTGSTFAWFTSKDEVTNRLSASANYGVSIAEDFQPHEDWIPGQPVNKDVSAVNTGNVDAFVRMWLEGEMSLIKRADNSKPVLDTNTTSLTATEDGDTMKKLGFLYHDDERYYKVLSATERTNPALNGTNANVDDNDYSEVKTVQAGGYLVYAPKDADDGYERWTYVTEQQETVVLNNDTTEVVAKDTKVGPVYSAGASKDIKGAPCKIDSDTFVPQTPGLYIFRRTIDLDENANTLDHFEYSGYLFDGINYFALYSDPEDGNSDYVLPDRAVTVATTTEPQKEPLTYTLNYNLIGFYTASETIVENDKLSWSYDSTNKVLTATYNGGTSDDDTEYDDVIIDVTLANIGTGGQTWVRQAPKAEGKMNTFYYNDDLEAGDTTAKLVDTVTLNKDVTQKAFLAFDFDLNVFLESVQVTLAEDGNEMTTPVEGTNGVWATASDTSNASPASAEAQNKAEIADIKWN